MKRYIFTNFRFDENKLKKIGSFVLTTALIVTLSTPVKGETTICHPGAHEYHQRIYEYRQDKEYNESVESLYNDSQLSIDGELYPIEKFFITISTKEDGYELHLMNIKSEYNDILIGSKDKFPYDNVIRFRDTTAFIELINSDCVLIDYEKNIITIIDKEKAIDIINKWDGMIHDKVPETDAVYDKEFLRR